MKKLLFIALMAIGANAQTNVTKDSNNWVTGVRGVYDATSSIEFKPAGQLDLKSSNGVNVNGMVVDTRGWVTSRGASFSEKVNAANGAVNATSTEVVNGQQLHTTNNNVTTVNDRLSGQVARIDQQVTRLDGQVQRIDGLVSKTDATNTKVNTNTTAINNLQNTKADKTQVATDIAQAKNEAITASNSYTDTKVASETTRAKKAESALNDKIDLNAETAKLYTDSSIQATETKLNKRIDALEIKIDNRFNAVMSYVGNEFNAVNNRIEGLGAATVALGAAATSQVYNSSKPTNLNVGTGVYGKATAIAVGMSHYFNQNTKLSVNWASGSNTKNLVGIGCGISF